MYWRLTLDHDLSLATTPGLIRSVHSSDFSQRAGTYADTWRDPVSRLLWLRPNWLDGDYTSNMRGLAEFRVQSASMWREVTRSPQDTDLFSLVHPVGWAYTDAELADVTTDLPTVDAAGEDTMYWALQSSGWQLDADEGFVIYYHNLTDELMRRSNWFGVQWGRLFLHFSGGGAWRLYEWDLDTALTDAPTLMHSGTLCGPGEQMARTGFIAITPIPGMGITLHFPQVLVSGAPQTGSAETAVGHGILIPYPSHAVEHLSGWPRIADAGPLTIALNPYTANVLGVQQTRYPASGTFDDGMMDTMTLYTEAPSQVTATLMPRVADVYSDVTGSMRGPSGAWVTGTDRQGQVRLTLTTSNTIYTPFVLGYTVEWPAAFTTRTTTPVQVVAIESLEWSQDARLRNEGEATLYLRETDAQTIAQRGDTTCLLEYSTDNATWTTAFGGFATDWHVEAEIDNRGLLYRARCTLRDLTHRMEETHVNLATAFDWMTVADAVDNILKASSMTAVLAQEPELDLVTVPGSPTGTQWRYAPNIGDSGLEALDAVLMHARQQGKEWILRYDYDADGWVTEARAHSTIVGALDLVPTLAERDPDNAALHYETCTFRPEPPEANVIQIAGVTDPDSGGVRYVSPPCVNHDSIDDDTSADYLGRAVLLLGTLGEAPTQREVNLMARRVYDAVAHTRVQATVTMTDWHESVVPNAYCTVYRNGGNVMLLAWIKRRTIRVSPAGPSLYWPGAGDPPTKCPANYEQVTLELDTIWETGLDD